MKKINYGKFFITLIIIIIITILFVFNYKIETLEKHIMELQDKITNLERLINSKVEYTQDGFNYLAIGNSITWHEKCEYWWDEYGMAASEPEKDFFHLVTKHLEEKNEKVNSYAFKYSSWEQQSWDRAGTYSLLEPYLSKEIDLITLQLSENVTEMSTFEKDLIDLIEYVRLKCPEAQIILIDDFWYDDKSDIKKSIAIECEVDFVDLTEIRKNTEYQSVLGSTVSVDGGKNYVISHAGVAIHPGDKGMKYIADKIIELIK